MRKISRNDEIPDGALREPLEDAVLGLSRDIIGVTPTPTPPLLSTTSKISNIIRKFKGILS